MLRAVADCITGCKISLRPRARQWATHSLVFLPQEPPFWPPYTSNKLGIDVGVGIAFGSVWHGKFFADAKYNRIIANYHTDYVPVTFGFRW